MNLHIAGGKGEHGRNCFCIDDGKNAYLLDCGIMAGDRKNPYPNLTQDEIRRLKVIFLSHSHADHTGALSWIFSNGFNGIVAATEETFMNLKTECPNKVFIEDWKQMNLDRIFKIDIKFGKSGHCLGSIWLMLNFIESRKKILYTGDYTEHSQLYECDRIRKTEADLALIDCAYGNNGRTYKESVRTITETVRQYLSENRRIALPVPKNGRAAELLYVLNEELEKSDRMFFADEYLYKKFSRNAYGQDTDWYKKSAAKLFHKVKPYTGIRCTEKGIIFLSEPQLKSRKSLYAAKKILENGGMMIFTGSIEKNTPAQRMTESGQAQKLIYPVHQNQDDCIKLCNKNKFRRVITFHSADDECLENTFYF